MYFENNYNKNNYLHYNENDVVSISMTYPNRDKYEYESYRY